MKSRQRIIKPILITPPEKPPSRIKPTVSKITQSGLEWHRLFYPEGVSPADFIWPMPFDQLVIVHAEPNRLRVRLKAVQGPYTGWLPVTSGDNIMMNAEQVELDFPAFQEAWTDVPWGTTCPVSPIEIWAINNGGNPPSIFAPRVNNVIYRVLAAGVTILNATQHTLSAAYLWYPFAYHRMIVVFSAGTVVAADRARWLGDSVPMGANIYHPENLAFLTSAASSFSETIHLPPGSYMPAFYSGQGSRTADFYDVNYNLNTEGK